MKRGVSVRREKSRRGDIAVIMGIGTIGIVGIGMTSL
jgi:threonine dehydrogenase-like Zn-dependent dehydrogenase